jgi:two-component system, LytTR family, sensor kinase
MAHVMNDIAPPTDRRADDERPLERAERPLQPGPEARPADGQSDRRAGELPESEGRRAFTRMAIAIIILFWATQFASLSVMRLVRMPEAEAWANIMARGMVTTSAILTSIGILFILRARRSTTLLRRVLLAIGLAVAGAAIHSAVNMTVFYLIMPTIRDTELHLWNFLISMPMLVNDFVWYYAAISVLLLALTYGEDAVEKERRIAALEAQANSAQLKALRYQLNPHFLFNTLNSVASLISKRESGDAEAMVVNLSDFLRSTLRMDAAREIPLSEEIQLQSLYLDIEKIRFPQRLQVSIDVPEELRDALVPNLITQPLIENAIKYGVARSSEPVHLEIVAREAGGRLSLDIRDDGGDAVGADLGGTRVGLNNVARRLALHFGDSARFDAGPRREGGFSARMILPLRRS